jgi:hypothetical protein
MVPWTREQCRSMSPPWARLSLAGGAQQWWVHDRFWDLGACCGMVERETRPRGFSSEANRSGGATDLD